MVTPLHVAFVISAALLVAFFCGVVAEVDHPEAATRRRLKWYLIGTAITGIAFLMTFGGILFKVHG